MDNIGKQDEESGLESQDNQSGEQQESAKDADGGDSLTEALAKEKERSEQNLANWQRAQADLTNFRKRVEQEKKDLAKFANVGIITSLLTLLDDFERANATIPQTLLGVTWIEGVFLMQRKLISTLESFGLTEVEAFGQDFDPNIHEAVMYGEGDDGKVVEQLQKGYKLNDRVIRPSMVKVGQGTIQSIKDVGEDNSNETSQETTTC